MLGIVFAKGSARYLPVARARELVSECPRSFCFVGVFVDEEASHIREVATRVGLKKIQLHGVESPSFCGSFSLPVIKAFRVANASSNSSSNASENDSCDDLGQEADRAPRFYTRVESHLFDSKSGGSGSSFDWQRLNLLDRIKPWILAGGLKAENIARAVSIVRPDGVDLSSSVARDDDIRRKDYTKIETFIRALRTECARSTTC